MSTNKNVNVKVINFIKGPLLAIYTRTKVKEKSSLVHYKRAIVIKFLNLHDKKNYKIAS